MLTFMEPKIYTSADHHIRNDLIDPNALVVLKRLHEAGYIAYLVGGGVRDLLMRKRPKDFDISTSARPEEVKQVFRNALLIGRRFPLAHVRFGKEIIEVSTFRSGEPIEEELVVRDSLWGTPEQDVLRRDFTINGLFYDPLDHRIIDYVGGFEDLQAHMLRTIGDPKLRFKQDPVRMIRMEKFRARFGFHVDPQVLKALDESIEEIKKSSPARVLEEILRMLESGHSEPFFRLIFESKLLKILLPALHEAMEGPAGDSVFKYLKTADSLNDRGHYKPLDRSILASALVFPIIDEALKSTYEGTNHTPHIGEIMEFIGELINKLVFEAFSHFPRKIRLDMQFILQMQYRLTPLDKRKHARAKLAKQRDFVLPLTFLKLRAHVDHSLIKPFEHWKKLWKEAEEDQEDEEDEG